MTNEIEMTKREMYSVLKVFRHCAAKPALADIFETELEAHLEALRQDRIALVEERDTLRNRVQVLELANITAGDVVRSLRKDLDESIKNWQAARLLNIATSVQDPNESVAIAALDAKTAAILGAVVDVQRIVTDWTTKGLKAKEGMRLISNSVKAGAVLSAMRTFEQPSKPEVSVASLAARLANCKTLADVAIQKALKDLVINGIAGYQMTVGEHGIDVTTLSAAELMAQDDLSFTKATGFCQHEFHPKFPAGEMCTYCGVSK